jgi:thiol-disulfide isomerase/thioredoxin
MALALALALATFWATPATAATEAVARDQHGETHAWRAAEGDLLVIDFAASWCAPCRRSLPRLEAFAKAHPEMEILVVSVDETAAQRDSLVKDLGLTLPVVWDEGFEIAEHYHPTAMPHTLVVDGKGEVLRRVDGSSEAEWNELAAWLEERSGGP